MARILLFDIDMTLIRTNHAGRSSIDAAFAQTFDIPNATAAMRIDGRTDRAIFAELVSVHQVSPQNPDAAIDALAEAYLATLATMLPSRDGAVLPGVPSLLAVLTTSHRLIGLATGNMRRGAEIKLGHFGLWDRFAGGGFGDSTPVRAEVVSSGMREVARLLGINPSPHDTIVIGDTPLDIEAARSVGARTLAVATGSYGLDELRAANADWVAEDLSDTTAIAGILAS